MRKLFIMIISTFLLFSCKDKEIYYRFTDEERKLFPSFKVGDTLTYHRLFNNKYEKYVVQNIENGFNVIKSQGSWAKEFYE